MPSRFLIHCTPLILSACLATAFLAAPAHAAKVMDFHADQLMLVANELKGSLNLTPNQLTLWQQVSARSATLLRSRQIRRDRLQSELKRRLGEADPDLRALSAGVDEEAAVALAENRQLSEYWLTVHDALDDMQRATVLQWVAAQLDRVDADPERAQRPAGREGKERGGPGGPGGRGQRPGGMGAPGA